MGLTGSIKGSISPCCPPKSTKHVSTPINPPYNVLIGHLMEYLTLDTLYSNADLHGHSNINMEPPREKEPEISIDSPQPQSPLQQERQDSKKPLSRVDVKQNGFNAAGYLNKKGEVGLVKSYKKRWFQVEKDALVYYEKEGGEKKGAVDFKDVTDVVSSNQKYGFNLITKGGRVYDLTAMNDSDKANWMEVIKEAIEGK